MRAGLLAAATLAALPATAQGPPVDPSPSWIARRLEEGFSQATGGTLKIGSLDVEWTSLSARARDVTLTIPAGDAPPLTASIADARLALDWSAIAGLASGRIHIAKIEARGGRFSCSRAWIDAFERPAARAGASRAEIRVDHLALTGASADYEDGTQKVHLHADDVSYEGDWSVARRLLSGEASGRVAVSARPFARPWSATVRGGLRLGARRLEIVAARAQGPGARGELSGNVTWGAGASFIAEGRAEVDFAEIRPYLAGRIPLAGRAAGPVRIVYVSGSPVTVVAQANARAFAIGPVVTTSATAEVTIRPGALEVDRIDGRAYGGHVTGRVSLRFSAGEPLEVHVAGRGLDVARLTALSGRTLPLAADTGVTLDLEGEAARPESWQGRGAFDATARATAPAPKAVPVAGRGTIAFQGGRFQLASDALDAGSGTFRLRLDAPLSRGAPIALSLDGATRDAAATQAAALVVLDAIGAPRNRFASLPIAGRGRLRATVESGAELRVALGADLVRGSYDGEPFDRAGVDLALDDHAVALTRLDVVRGDERLHGALSFGLPSGTVERVDLHADNVAIGPLLARFAGATGLAGRLDGDLVGDAAGGGFAASGSATVRGLLLGKEIVASVSSPVRVEGSRVFLPDVAVRGSSLSGRLEASYDLAAGTGTVDARSLTVDLSAARTLAEAGLEASGSIEARGAITLAPDGPHGFLTLAASAAALDLARAGLRTVQLGDLTGSATVSPQGAEISVRAEPVSAWTFDAFLGFRATLPLSAVLYFDDLRVEAGTALGQSADARLKGQIQAEGDLTEPRAMEVNGAFDDVQLRLGPRVVRSVAPFPLTLESGRFALGPARFEGEGADVSLRAGGSIAGGEVEGRLAGSLDLGAIASLRENLRGAGATSFDIALSGTTDAPALDGEIAVHDGRVRLLGTATSLEHIEAKAVFSGQTLTLASFRALAGGGEISAQGRVSFTGLAPSELHAELSLSNVGVNAPEGFHGVFDGNLAVDGTPKSASVTGRLELASGLYSKNFDLSGFGGGRREVVGAAESTLPKNVSLDVDLTAPGTIVLRNDIAKIEASGAVHLGGALAKPEVTGRISIVPGGVLTYRDVDYRLDYGTVDLTDRNRINPYVDVRGHTRVGSYEIALRVEGTADHFEYELTSTPPLSSQDIISLLVTGRTLDTLSGSAATASLPADMAAYYFAGLLTSTFGKQIQQSLGVDQLEVTPLLLKGQTDPTARVTVGKRVSNAVKIVFSQDIGTAERQTYQVVWDATRRVRVIAESDSETGPGGEIQYSQMFGGAPITAAPAAAGAPGSESDEPGPIASIAIRDAANAARPELFKAPRIHVGDAFSRGAMYAGAERIRTELVDEGRVESAVRPEATYEAASRTYAIVYHVVVGPKVAVEVTTTDGRGKRDLRRALRSFVRETPYAMDYWDEAAHALVTRLNASGYYAADVTWSASNEASSRVVRFRVDRGAPVKLRALRFHGVSALPLARVREQVTSLQSSGLHKRLLRPAQLSDDLAAVRALYRDEGYARVRIGEPEIRLTAKGEAAEVDVSVDEGDLYRVASIDLPDGLPAPPAELIKAIPLKKGGVYSPRRLSESEQALREFFDRRGYPEVAVDSQVVLDAGEAKVAFAIVPGGRRTVADVVVEGNRSTRRNTITNALTFGVGDPLSRDRLLQSQQHLYRMGLFSTVKLDFEPVPGRPAGESRVRVAVREAPPWNLGVGVGYDSEDGPRASFLLGYANLAGRDIGIAFQGFFSAKDKQAQVTLRRRQIFGLPSDSLASLLFERTVQTGFTETRRAASVRLEKRPRPRWISFIRYSVQQVNIGDVIDIAKILQQHLQDKTVEQLVEDKLTAIRLASVGYGLVRDTRDDPFTPTRGGYASIDESVFSKLVGSQADFVKVFLRGSAVVDLGRDVRFATFLRIGAEKPFSGTDIVPLSERFFAGGSNTLRGFDTDTVGELGPAGGEGLFIMNEELLFPLWKALRGEIFLDAGNVYPSIRDFNPVDLRSSSGLGLRLDTPIGPVRAEYGWKLDRKVGESGGAFYFSIGTLF